MSSVNIEMTLSSILSQYGIAPLSITALDIGLINRTWLVKDQHHKYILQLVNPMFSPVIHADIDTVTRYLSGQGMITPRLLRTLNNQLYCSMDDGIWRMFDYIDGYTVNSVDKPAIAFEAGVLLARFHAGLHPLQYEFQYQRPGVHDTQRHLQVLRTALENHQGHARYADIQPLAIEILDTAARLPVLPETGLRKVHGDPKINNFLFERQTRKGICMLDFDTLGTMAWPLEMGDAMRSWCNPVGENSTETHFSMENYGAGLQGYISCAPAFITEQEWGSILPATQIIYVELAARFCADALNENYFSWDSSRFASHSEHSQLRAISQLNAYKSLKAQIHDVEKMESQHLADCICCH
jgi:Ser/Thr protein kinase RdoA (MazF antagonist)